MSGYVPSVFSESIKMYIGSCATGRARAGNTTLDTVVFAQLPGQPTATTFTPEDVGCPIAIIGGGPVNPLMPDVWEVQGATFQTTIAAYVSPSQVTLTDAPDTAFFNTGFFNIVVYRHCLMQLDAFELSKSIAPGTRDTFDFTVLSKKNPYIDRFTTIAMGQPVYVNSTDPAVRELYGGLIDTITTSNLVGTEGTFSWQCHCAGYDGVAGRRAVNPVFPQIITGPANDVFTKICLLYMSDEGIDVVSSITDVISIACPVGAYINTLLDQVVQALSAVSKDSYWYSDAWRNYHLLERTTTPAPWDIDDGQDLLAGQQPIQLQLTETHDKQSTFTYAVGTNILLDALNATIVGDGSNKTFNLPQKIAKVPTITLNGGAQTVGILGIDTGKDWYWNQGSTTLTQDPGGVTLTAADALLVAYQFTYAGVASSPNYTGAVERQKDEAGSGSYDHVIQISQIVTSDELLAIAVSYSQQYGIPAKTAKISTLRPGITTGQLQHITLPDIGADDDFLVATMKLSSKQKVLQWDYTAFSGANVGNGITGLVQFINRGEGTLQLLQPLVPITAEVIPAPAAGQNVIGRTIIGVGVDFPNSVTLGNLLVMVAERNSMLGNPPTVTDSQSNTWTQARFAQTGGGFPNQISILYTFASSSGPLTVNCASAEWQAMMEFSGVESTSPVETSGDAIGTTPPTLTLVGSNDLVVTGLANVAAVPTVSGSEVLLGYRANTSQPGVAYSYALPAAGFFTSTLADSGGSSASVFISVAFKKKHSTSPPAQTIDVQVNPSLSLTTKGDVQGFSSHPARIPVGTDGDVLTADSGAALGVSWQTPGAGSSGVRGNAQFSASGGSISNLSVSGCISNVTRTGVGAYTVFLSPNQQNFSVALAASDDATAATIIYIAGTPDFNSSLSSFSVQAFNVGGGGSTRDPGMVSIAILKT